MKATHCEQRILHACLVACVWLLSTSSLFAEIPSEIAATAWVRSGDRGVGTGFVVDVEKRWLVTARHVVADRDSVEAFFPDPDKDGYVPLRRHYIENQRALSERGRMVTGKVIARRDTADLALIQLDSLPKNTPALKLAKGPTLGDAVRLIGHRHDAETLWTETTGTVRQAGRLSEGYFWAGQKLGVGASVLFVQMPVEAGDSGAALLNSTGEVIGLLSAFSNRTTGVGIVIHTDEIRGLLADARKEKAPDLSTTKAGSIADQLLHATVWLRPKATDTRSAGVVIDHNRKLILTNIAGAGSDDVVTVVFPHWKDQRVVAEAEHYRDLLGMRLAGTSVQGIVLARDLQRDLALIQVDALPAKVNALNVAKEDCKQGERIHTMNHPLGVDLLWLYATGSVRSVAKVALQADAKEVDPKPQVSLLQIPSHGSSSGGAIMNERGELVGIVATREGPRQEMGYAVTAKEIQTFLGNMRPVWDPHTKEVLRAMAHTFAEHRRYEIAEDLLLQALHLDSSNPWVRLQGAFVVLKLNKVKLAKGLADGLAEEMLQTAELQAELGQLYVVLNEPKKAEALFAQAIKAKPKCVAALIGRGTIRTGKEALADLNEAIFLDSNAAQAYRIRAIKYDPRDADAVEKTFADLGRAIELQPYDLTSRQARAELYLERKEWKKSLADWQRIVELDELNASAWLGLAAAQLRSSDEAPTLASLIAVVRIDEKQFGKVCKLILQRGQLLDDGGADAERVCEWYVKALRGVQPWMKQKLDGLLKDAQVQTMADKRRMMLETALIDMSPKK